MKLLMKTLCLTVSIFLCSFASATTRIVTNTLDSGAGSLRTIIGMSWWNDTIRFCLH
ncbi:MAG: hypothetical protein AB8B74_06270 [Crocinitomicaceae bacterium]